MRTRTTSMRLPAKLCRTIFVLLLLVASIFGASQAPLGAQTPQPHPRIWLNGDRLARWKNYAGRGTNRWTLIKTYADQCLNDPNAIFDACLPLSLVYQVTGDARYANRAIAIVTAFATPAHTITNDEYYWFREVLPKMAATYDWCFDQMTIAQRQQVATWLMDRADDVWPDTNPARIGGWAVNSAPNNYFYGFLMTWPAALAILGDGTDTGVGSVSGSNRPLYHANLGMTKYRKLVRPFTDGWGKGGVFAESTNYDSVFRLGIILDAYYTSTGVDLANEVGFNFLKDSIQWRIHSTLPSMDIHYLIGDQPVSSYGYMNWYDRDRATIPAYLTSDVTAKVYGKFWLDHMAPATNPDQVDGTWEFMYYDEDGQSQDYTATLPPYYFATGPGIFVKRSSWAKDATYWGIWAGPLEQAHQNCAVGEFNIFKEGWLLGSASTYSWSGVVSDTKFHNSMTFGGNAQVWLAPGSPSGQTLHHEVGGDYNYFSGSAAPVYNWQSTVCSDYVRKMVVLNDSVFLVYDRATLLNSGLAKEWYLHSGGPITVSGRDYSFDNGKHRLWGRSLLPASGVALSVDPIALGNNNAVSSYRLNVVATTGQATDYLMNVLQVAPVSQPSVPGPVSIPSSTGNMDGSMVGNWVVMFGRSDLTLGQVAYQVTSANQTEHVVTDQIPATPYTITVTNAANGQPTTINTTSSNDGTLRFSVPPGSNSITLGAAPGTLISVSLSPNSVPGGTPSSGTVNLAGAAPAGGVVVNLSSSDPASASVPASVTVQAGNSSATFAASTAKVANDTNVTIKASAGNITRSTGLTVLGPQSVALSSLTLNPTTVTGGSPSTGTVTLTAPAPSNGFNVALTSSNANVAQVPPSVSVPNGQSSATFAITTSVVPVNTAVTITAAAGAASRTASLQVNAAPLTAPLPPTNLVAAGGNAQAALTWNGSAGATSYNVKRSLVSGGPYTTIAAIPGTSYVDNGLTNGTSYFYVVTAVNAQGESGNSNEAWAIPLSAPQVLRINCGGPAYVSALMGSFQADAYFTGGHTGRTSSNITNTSDPELYRTYRAAGSGESITYSLPAYNGSYTLNLHFAEVYCTMPGERVFDINVNGTTLLSKFDPFSYCGGQNVAGIVSRQINVTTGSVTITLIANPACPIINAIELIPNNNGAPPPPANLTAQAGDAQVILSWNPSLGASGYNVKRSLTAGGPYSTIASNIAPTTFTDTTVTNGTTYFYVVTAVNSAGESGNSNEASATPGPVPPAPTNLVAVPGDTTVNLSWSDTPRATSYKVKRSTTPGGPYTVIASGVLGTTYADSGLTNGTTYYYVVSAVNSYGEGPNSNEANATPNNQKPDAPANLTAQAGDKQVTLGWNPAARANTYNVKRALVAGGPYTTIASGLTGTTYTDSGLTNGTTYYYVVSGSNAAGEGANSNEANATPKSLAPPPPTGLTATPGDTQISLSWTASPGAATYNIYRALTSNGEGAIPYMTGITATTFVNTGLTNGTAYFYQVTAVNSSGESGKSNEATATPNKGVDPPTNLTASPGDTVAYLGWTASPRASSYKVKRSTVNGGPYTTIATGVTGTTYVNDSLVNGTTYYYVVTAVAAAGESPNSNQASAMPNKQPPAAPTNLTAVATGSRTNSLSWKQSARATAYKLWCAGNSGGPYTLVAGGIPGTSYIHDGLTSGKTYYYVVTAVNSGGESPNSNEANATPGQSGGGPTGLTATAGNQMISLTWNPLAKATSYNLKRSLFAGGPYSTIATGITGTTYVNAGLTNGVTYYYVVTAIVNGAETGNSNEASATPFLQPPGAPTGLTANALGGRTILLRWGNAPRAASYNIKRSLTPGGPYQTIATGVVGNSYYNDSLTSGTTYYYVVSASNSGGEGPNSNEASATAK